LVTGKAERALCGGELTMGAEGVASAEKRQGAIQGRWSRDIKRRTLRFVNFEIFLGLNKTQNYTW
jgi:hypothetical protein